MTMPAMHIGPDGAEHTGTSKTCPACIAMVDDGFYPPGSDFDDAVKDDVLQVDWVNPPHYRRGPKLKIADGVWKMVECIDVVRAIPDYRLANAIRYIWRVAFGGKWNNNEDIRKAVWYLNDFLDNPIEPER